MEKKMENDMEAGVIMGYIGIMGNKMKATI